MTHSLFYFTSLLILQICSGSLTYENGNSNGNVKSRMMDMGNGVLIPDANDLMHQAIAASNVMSQVIPQMPPTGPIMVQTSSQMYPTNGYMEPYVDNSIFAHISIITRMFNNIISLLIDSFGIVPSSFYIGDSPPPFVKLMMIRRESQELTDVYNKFLSIITQDLVGIDKILSYIPGYSIIKSVIGVPTYLAQKVIQFIQDFTRMAGLF